MAIFPGALALTACFANPDQAMSRALWQSLAAILAGVFLALVGWRLLRERVIEPLDKHDLEMSLAKFAMDHASVEIYWLDSRAHICYVNDRACQTLGYSREELMGMTIPDIDPNFPVEAWENHWEALKQARSQHFETLHRRKDGSTLPVQISANYVQVGAREFNVAFAHDLSARVASEERIRQLAYFDTLTGLPNRRMLSDRLRKALAASKRSDLYGAVMFLDLDRLKPLNDHHGHGAGDQLLIAAACRMVQSVREVDTVARFGGDEFVIMLTDLAADKQEAMTHAQRVAEKILANLAKPYQLEVLHTDGSTETITYSSSGSIGITLFLDHLELEEEILSRADAAMYRAKDQGRNTICVDGDAAG